MVFLRSSICFLALVIASAADTTQYVDVTAAANAPTQQPEPHIIGGSAAIIGQFPFQVYLNIMSSILCGGTIISERHILTAAHCVYQTQASQIIVVAGAIYRGESFGDKMQVQRVFVHQEYNETSLENDIAVLKLTGELKYGQTISDIKLQSGSLTDGTKCTVSGWGITHLGETSGTYELRYVEVPLVGINECSSKTGFDIQSSQICAGYDEGGKDSCSGDSGGPLFYNGYIVGIVSYGVDCALPNNPGVYTNVAYYKNWIENAMANNARIATPQYLPLVFFIAISLHYCKIYS